MRNPILGMASHDLCIAKTAILGATPGAIPGIVGNAHERFVHCEISREHCLGSLHGDPVVRFTQKNPETFAFYTEKS